MAFIKHQLEFNHEETLLVNKILTVVQVTYIKDIKGPGELWKHE